MAAIGWWIVVSAGQTEAAIEVSSKPAMLTSFGTSSPSRCATEQAAAAMSSLAAKIAVGRGVRANRRSAACSRSGR